MMDSHSCRSKIRTTNHPGILRSARHSHTPRIRARYTRTVCASGICGLFLSAFLFLASPAFAANTTGQILNRLSSLESRWGHLHLGGKITFSTDYFTYDGVFDPEAPGEFPSLEGSSALWQELQIFLNARLDRHFDLSLSFAGQDFYGSQQLSGFSLFLNETILRYRSSNLLADLGRLNFSLDPLGLIADRSSYPVEGLVVQTGTQNYYLGGYYSRLAGEELALRLAFPQPGYMAGITVVPFANSAVAIDLLTEVAGGILQGELAWYRPDQKRYPEASGAFGSLLAWKRDFSLSSLTLQAGRFEEGFSPFSSRLAHVATNGNAINFAPNTYGVAGEYLRKLQNGWNLLLKAGLSYPCRAEENSSGRLSFSGRIQKTFSSSISLEAGYDYQPPGAGNYGFFICRLTALF
ncbi:MAG: hypothetical protein GX085_01495 [Firmicutes bacterium]|nr:hypothetical protein [Bacillota bacterium]